MYSCIEFILESIRIDDFDSWTAVAMGSKRFRGDRRLRSGPIRTATSSEPMRDRSEAVSNKNVNVKATHSFSSL